MLERHVPFDVIYTNLNNCLLDISLHVLLRIEEKMPLFFVFFLQYNFGEVIGKCINEDCQHPSSPLYNKTLNVPGGQDGEEKENKENAAGDGEKKKEDNERVTEKENEEGGKSERTEDLKTEQPQMEDGENIKSEKEPSRNAYVGGGSIF